MPENGPPAPPVYRPQPLMGRQDDPQQGNVASLWPLLVDMGLDMLSTETGVRPGETRISSHGIPFRGAESNPFPGMGSAYGRLGWGLAEALTFQRLTKNDPRLRQHLLNALSALHESSAMSNFQINREAQ